MPSPEQPPKTQTMKRKVLILLACVSILFLASACSKAEYDVYSNISGTVIDVNDGSPIGQVAVTLSPGGLNIYTGSDGHFDFKEIEAQHYTICAQKPGYSVKCKDIDAPSGETVNVSITMMKQ